MDIEQAYNTAMRLHLSGNIRDAEKIYRQILAAQPKHPDAMHMLGVMASQTRQYKVAVEVLKTAVSLKPGASEFHHNLGLAYSGLDRIDEAAACHRKAIELQPDFPEAINSLGECLRYGGKKREAVELFEKSLALRPNYPEALNNLGNALSELGKYDAAVEAYQKAIALRPAYAETHSNLAYALALRGDLPEARAACEKALSIRPTVEALNNFGSVLRELGEFDQSIDAYQRALKMDAKDARSHWNMSMSLLLKGDFAQGWTEYEWRWKAPEYAMPRRNFPQPRWEGEALNGRRVLVYAEQGLGDTIQFARYLPMILERGGKPILECHLELVRLITGIEGLTVVRREEALPEFDLHVPLMSLAKIFGTDAENIPANVPYLRSSNQVAVKWAERLGGIKKKKVGLAWAGHGQHQRDRYRSLTLSQLAPLAEAEDVQFVSLQKGDAANQTHTPPPGMKLVDWTHELTDFADTAGLIEQLDLVISADTAVAHLAGAMGKETWTLLPKVPDWRWLLERTDSPWYPTMRLFRQKTRGDWSDPIREIVSSLQKEAGGREVQGSLS